MALHWKKLDASPPQALPFELPDALLEPPHKRHVRMKIGSEGSEGSEESCSLVVFVIISALS